MRYVVVVNTEEVLSNLVKGILVKEALWSSRDQAQQQQSYGRSNTMLYTPHAPGDKWWSRFVPSTSATQDRYRPVPLTPPPFDPIEAGKIGIGIQTPTSRYVSDLFKRMKNNGATPRKYQISPEDLYCGISKRAGIPMIVQAPVTATIKQVPGTQAPQTIGDSVAAKMKPALNQAGTALADYWRRMGEARRQQVDPMERDFRARR